MTVYKQHKKYSRPKKLFSVARIAEDKSLVQKYGLKNKREIWRADFIINKIRGQAKGLITSSRDVQKEFISKQAEKGFLKKNSEIDDVLDLKKENLLDRRLQTIVFKKGMAKTIKEARQFIVHRNIIVNNHIVNAPSYLVNLKEENMIELKKPKKQKPKEEQKKEIIEPQGEENA